MTTLSLNPYRPKLDDPRVRRRLKNVLTWCDGLLGQKRPKQINSASLRKVFGNVSQPFGGWLRANLLIQVGSYEVGKCSYSYVLNESGYEKLCAMAGIETRSSVEVAVERYSSILSGEVVPEYKDNGTRRYHPIQNLPREDRRIAFAGWWDYDIEASAATLVCQYAARKYRDMHPNTDNPFPSVNRLINEKEETRQHVMALCSLDLNAAKELLQSLLFRAPLTPNSRCSIYRLLGEDRARLESLKQDPFIKSLVSDVKKMWRFAIWADKYERAMLMFEACRYAPHKIKASEHRHAIYLSLERRVMDAIHTWFGTDKFPGVLMHDGFLSMLDVDTHALVAHVKETTGYTIKIKKERLAEAR